VTVEPGTVLWRPPPDARRTSRLGRFLTTVEERTGRRFDTYEDAWRWSVGSLAEFWAAVWDYAGIIAHRPYETVLAQRAMPGARWFAGATLNYAEHALRPAHASGSIGARP
jgi:acetoacetyl-CoA synthetase